MQGLRATHSTGTGSNGSGGERNGSPSRLDSALPVSVISCVEAETFSTFQRFLMLPRRGPLPQSTIGIEWVTCFVPKRTLSTGTTPELSPWADGDGNHQM